jgi:hypothetical protein
MLGRGWRGTSMREGITVEVNSTDRLRLEAIRRGSEQCAEACVASAHRSVDGGRSRANAIMGH